MRKCKFLAVSAVICTVLYGNILADEPSATVPVAAASSPHFVHPGAIYTQEDIDLAKTRALAGKQPWKDAYDEMMREADEALKVIPNAPQKFDLPGRYVDPKANLEGGREIVKQSRAAYLLALASLMTDNPEKSKDYATHAAALLKAWTGCTDMGSMVKIGNEEQSALESCATGNGFIAAADFLYQSPEWPAADRAAFLDWVQQVYRKATVIKRINIDNNWNDWGTYAALLSDYLLEDATPLKFAPGGGAASPLPPPVYTTNKLGQQVLAADQNLTDSELLKVNIARQIEPDGSMPKELARGQGKYWYTYYALTPMTLGAIVVRHATGEDLMNRNTPTGKSIRAGIDYFIANLLQRDYHSLIEAAGGIYDDKSYLALNRGTRPVTGLHDHNGWNFPTLFLKPDDVPVNQPPVAIATISPNPAKTGEEVVFDAAASTHPDGGVKSYLWSFEGEKQTATFVESLINAGDLLNFPAKQQGQFALEFDIRIDQPGDTAVGLQSSAVSGISWNSAPYLFSVNGGRFTVRDGPSYRSDADFSYVPGKTYHIRFEVNVPLRTWSTQVTDDTQTVQLAKSYAMREGAEASDISKVIYMGAAGSVVSNVHLESSGEELEGVRVTKKFASLGKQKISLTVTDDVGALDTTVMTLEVSN